MLPKRQRKKLRYLWHKLTSLSFTCSFLLLLSSLTVLFCFFLFKFDLQILCLAYEQFYCFLIDLWKSYEHLGQLWPCFLSFLVFLNWNLCICWDGFLFRFYMKCSFLIFKKIIYFIICIWVFYLHYVCTPLWSLYFPVFLQRLEDNICFPGTGGIDGYKQPCECWEVNTGPL